MSISANFRMGSSNVSSGVRAGQVDMISHLPDEIICRILSLIPTKYSIRTSALSKRWERLWIFLPKLDFEFNPYDYESPMGEQLENSFTRSVDLLFLQDDLCIQSFRLCLPHDDYDDARINGLRLMSWFFGVLKYNLRELDLEIGLRKLPDLPWMLFTCKTLVVLKICGLFVLNVPYYVRLPNLKTLVLDRVIYSDAGSIPMLLSGCPILEDLELLRDARGDLSLYDVSHPTIKRLTLQLDDPDDGPFLQSKIMVDAPNLEFFELNHLSEGSVLVNSLPSTAEVHATFYQYSNSMEDHIEHGNIVVTFLKCIANLKSLTLSHDNLQYSSHVIGSNLPIFCNLVRLNIELVSAIFPKLLMGFLENSPKLEVLSLPYGIRSNKTELHYEIDVEPEYGWQEPQHVPKCLLHSLLIIQIYFFNGEEEELNSVKYLLENAMVLLKMIIITHHSDTSAEFVRFHTELVKYSMGSIDCEIDFWHS